MLKRESETLCSQIRAVYSPAYKDKSTTLKTLFTFAGIHIRR